MISLPGLTCGVRFRCFRVAIRLKAEMSIDWAGFDHNGFSKYAVHSVTCFGSVELVCCLFARMIRLYIYRSEPHSILVVYSMLIKDNINTIVQHVRKTTQRSAYCPQCTSVALVRKE